MRADEPARVIRPDIPRGRRVIVISDIHGNLDFLKGLLEKTKYKAGEDVLILLGDLIERGRQNLGTLRHVMKLAEKPLVYVISGNCDLYHQRWLLAENEATAAAGYWDLSRYMFLGELCDDAGIDRLKTPFEKVKAILTERYAAELAFLNGFPTILETEHYLFVHGGIPEKVPAYEMLPAKQYMKCDDFVGKGLSFDKTVVVGHWPVSLYRDLLDCTPLWLSERNICSIDGGCVLKTDGQLNAMIIPNIGEKVFTFTHYDGLPTRIAAEDQAPSASWYTTHWNERQVRILEEGEAFSRVERLSDGAVFEVPCRMIYMYHEELCCDDYTDFLLPVTAGETLSVLFETSRGAYCKKNGVTGWYKGAFSE